MFSSSLRMVGVLNFSYHYSAVVSQKTSVPAPYRRALGSISVVHNVVSKKSFLEG